MTGIFYILFFYFLGSCVGYLIGNFIPGSVIGMVLFFAALCLKIVKADDVRSASMFLLNNMALFFVPIGVGLMTSYRLVTEHLLAIVVSCMISTVLIIAVVGLVQQRAERKKLKV